jgi:hypothetical protein
MEERLVPDGRPLPFPVIYAGAGAGQAPVVKAYNAETGELNFEAHVYESSFRGGVRVGTGDFSGDGYPDVIVAPGRGRAPAIRVLDGRSGEPIGGALGNFLAYSPTFTGGVYVAAADVNGDNKTDVVTAAALPGGSRVKVFSGADGSAIANFVVPGAAFSKAITVAAADLTRDGKAEIVVGAGPAGRGWVRTYDPLSGTVIDGPLGEFRAFGTSHAGGVFVGADAMAGDVNADGTPDLAVGMGPAYAARVRVFSGATGEVLHDFRPFGSGVKGGARVALAYVDDDSHADVVVGSGPGVAAMVRVFSGLTGGQLAAPLGEYTPFGDSRSGVYVAATNDPPGTPGTADILVNTYTTGFQGIPSVAVDADGDFVVVWTGNGQDGSGDGIYAQRYSANGTALGSEFRVNAHTTGSQAFPSVAMDADGDFVVSWASNGQDGSYWGIYAQRYSASGSAQGSEFRVNSSTSGNQARPSVAVDADGDFVIAWQADSQDGSMYGVYAQRYAANGTAQGAEFRVNSYTSNSQLFPSVGMDADGDFVEPLSKPALT